MQMSIYIYVCIHIRWPCTYIFKYIIHKHIYIYNTHINPVCEETLGPLVLEYIYVYMLRKTHQMSALSFYSSLLEPKRYPQTRSSHYIYMYICICIYMYVYNIVYIYIYLCMYVYICLHVYINNIYTHIYICAFMYVYIYMHVCTQIRWTCTYIFTYIPMYIYKHIYIYINPVCEETLGLLHVTKRHQMFALSFYSSRSRFFSSYVFMCTLYVHAMYIYIYMLSIYTILSILYILSIL